MPIRARIVAAATFTVALTAALTTTGVAPAIAAPADCKTVDAASDSQAIDCITDLRLRAEQASQDASQADETYNQARIDAKQAATRASTLQVAADHAELVAQQSRARAAAILASMARGGGTIGQTTEVLLSGEGAGEVLYNLSRVSALSEDTTTIADDAARDSATAKALQADANAAADRASLTADEAKSAYDDAKKTAQAAATLVQQTESKRDQQQGTGASPELKAAYVDLPSDASVAAKVVAFARAQIGDPYVFGAAGPNSWDCSGLTMMAFQAAGIDIGGHGATVQFTTASAKGLLVPYSQAQPGDLLFWGTANDKFHVAIYSGGGNMIEAPHPGASVREVPVRTGGLTAMVARFTG